jgi:hypothetical protein
VQPTCWPVQCLSVCLSVCLSIFQESLAMNLVVLRATLVDNRAATFPANSVAFMDEHWRNLSSRETKLNIICCGFEVLTNMPLKDSSLLELIPLPSRMYRSCEVSTDHLRGQAWSSSTLLRLVSFKVEGNLSPSASREFFIQPHRTKSQQTWMFRTQRHKQVASKLKKSRY